MNLKTMKTLYKKELNSYFKSPLGYVFLVIFLFAMGYLTFEPGRGSFFLMREASLSAFFRYIPFLFLFLVPAICMRMWAEERKSGTIEVLLSLPLSVKEAVISKFLASWTFLGLTLLGTIPMVMTVSYLGDPDVGPIVLGYLASLFIGGVLIAVSGFFSALTKNQVVSFILAVVVGYGLMMAGSPPVLDFLDTFLPQYFLEVFSSLSVLNHFESMERGVLGLHNVWFFGVFIVSWLYGSIVLLQENKAS